MARRARRRLAVGAPMITRFFAFLGASLTTSVGILLVSVVVWNAYAELRRGADDWWLTTLLLLVFVVPGLYILVAVTIPMLGRLTSGVWLRGTTLRSRVFFETTSVDLATADIQRGADGKTLIARDPVSGSTVTVPLRGEGSLRLPSGQLRAIADAVSQGTARVTSTDDPVAVADELRVLARS
jgi:hypothetical protein